MGLFLVLGLFWFWGVVVWWDLCFVFCGGYFGWVGLFWVWLFWVADLLCVVLGFVGCLLLKLVGVVILILLFGIGGWVVFWVVGF